MKQEDFDLFSSILKQRSGLILTREKVYLLESRLMPVARKAGLKDLEDLAREIRDKREEKVLEAMTDAMTTNETFFFRDQKPFEQFRQVVLPHILKARAGQKSFRIWSAAASTGQEAYSLAMILCEEAEKLEGWKVEIVGTDISAEVVEKARAGLYNQFEVQRGLPVTYLLKYFVQNADKWQVNEKLRAMVQFRRLNLLSDWASMGSFDVVFCRNVLIYFEPPTKTSILDKMAQIMAPDGALFLGGAETVMNISEKFKSVESLRGIYVPSACPAGVWATA